MIAGQRTKQSSQIQARLNSIIPSPFGDDNYYVQLPWYSNFSVTKMSSVDKEDVHWASDGRDRYS